MRSKTKKKAKTWFNSEIPAKLFFNILESGNYDLLVKDIESNERLRKPSQGELERVWVKIYDEFFILMDNKQLKLIAKVKKTVLMMIRKIETIKPVIYALAKHNFNKEQQTELITGLRKYGVKIDISKGLVKEINRVINVDIPGMETGLEIELDNLAKLQAGEKQTFESNCVLFEEFDFKVAPDASLKLYIEYEKAVIKKAARLKKNDTKNG